MRKPLPLRKGDVIAICAPAGPVDAARLDRGIARLSRQGSFPRSPTACSRRKGTLRGATRTGRASSSGR